MFSSRVKSVSQKLGKTPSRNFSTKAFPKKAFIARVPPKAQKFLTGSKCITKTYALGCQRSFSLPQQKSFSSRPSIISKPASLHTFNLPKLSVQKPSLTISLRNFSLSAQTQPFLATSLKINHTFFKVSGVRKFTTNYKELEIQSNLLSNLTGYDPIEIDAVHAKSPGKVLNAEEFRAALKKHWSEKTELNEEQKKAKAYLESINYYENMLEDFAADKAGLTTTPSQNVRDYLIKLNRSSHTTSPEYEEDPVDPWFGTDKQPVRLPVVGHVRQFGSDEDDGKFHSVRDFKKHTTILDTGEQLVLQDIKGPVYGYGHH